MRSRLINFTIPKNLLEEIDKVAERESRSRSELLREAVRTYVGKTQRSFGIEKDPMIEWQKKYAKKLSGWDIAAEIRRARGKRWNLSSMPR